MVIRSDPPPEPLLPLLLLLLLLLLLHAAIASADATATATMAGNATLSFNDDATLTVHSGALLHGWGYIGYESNNGGTSLVNNGTISADFAGQTLTIYVPSTLASFTNNGTVTVSPSSGLTDYTPCTNDGTPVTSDGTLIINNTLSGGGTFTAENGGSITVNGLWTQSSPPTINAISANSIVITGRTRHRGLA